MLQLIALFTCSEPEKLPVTAAVRPGLEEVASTI